MSVANQYCGQCELQDIFNILSKSVIQTTQWIMSENEDDLQKFCTSYIL